jgi:hypothetical protein
VRVLWFQYFEVFSLLCALWCRRGLNRFSLGIMIPILLLDNITEIVAVNYAHLHWKSNHQVYNLYYLLSTPLYFYLFSAMLGGSTQERRRLLWSGVVVEVLLLASICFVQGWGEFNTFSALVVALASIILSCLLLARLAIRKDDKPGLLRDPYFWINAMILLFNLVTFIVLGLHKYIVQYHLEFGHKNLYFAISQAANAVLYTGYTCAFFLCRFQKSK